MPTICSVRVAAMSLAVIAGLTWQSSIARAQQPPDGLVEVPEPSPVPEPGPVPAPGRGGFWLGLGLGGARRLVNEFAIQSEVGRGTTITIARWT